MSESADRRPPLSLVRPSADDLRAQLPELERAITLAGDATDQLVDLQGLADEILQLAQEAHADHRADFERQRELLEAYDRDSERVLAETSGRVRSLRAQLQHRRGASNGIPVAPGELAALEGELASAERRDQLLVSERLNGREWIATRVRSARMAVILSGEARLALSGPHVESLRAIERAGKLAEEKRGAILASIRAQVEEQRQRESSLRLVTPPRAPLTLSGEPDTASHAVDSPPANSPGGASPC